MSITRFGLVFLLVAALALPDATRLAAQEVPGRASGQVVGSDDRPLVGATVDVWPSGNEGAARSPMTTDEDGRWSVTGLEPGRWEIEISADGHFPATGWFQVRASQPSATVDVSLRSLDERTPSFAENQSTVLRWIEKGNVLLEQGEAAAARAEYEKALLVLPRDQRPQVLQAVARTHFMDGESELAVERLQEALAITPEDPTLRQLFLTLLKTTGRLDEAEAMLAQAEAESRKAVEAEPAGQPAIPTRQQVELPPAIEPEAGRTGRFRAILQESSSLSALDVYLERHGLSEEELRSVDPKGGVYDLSEESFSVYVPEGYEAQEPHGLFVWVSPTPLGGFRNPEFERVLAERKLIWVGAYNSGNGRLGWYRSGLALDAVESMKSLYNVDENRIYVSGYSGGGRISSSLAMLYPEVFRGGFFTYGCDYFEQLPVPDRPGSFWPARFPSPGRAAVERLKTDSRFVLLTGDQDFNRPQTRQIYKQMERSGFEHLTYLQIPEADHYFGLPPEWLEKGVDGLDGD
jgi:tetratricopeptide (TPR) repeat protein